MSTIVFTPNASGTGNFTITSPNSNTNRQVDIPDAAGGIVIDSATQTLTNKTLTSPTISGTPVMSASVITSGTANTSLSGSAIDFTGIPSWVKRVTVMFKSVSTSGTSPLIVQAGTSGGVVTSGYTGGAYNPAAFATNTTGFLLSAQSNAANLMSCIATLLKVDTSNTWVFGSYSMGVGINTHAIGGGDIALSGVLDRVRITTNNGTDTFDAGSLNILYE